MIAYFDSSIVLRRLLREANPLAEWDRVSTPQSSDLTRLECLRTVERGRFTHGSGDDEIAASRAQILDLLRGFDLLPVSRGVLARAGDPFPTSLKSLDAIHLASALELRTVYPDLRFATHDRGLANAARAIGFVVIGV